jgi:hypothetical protein
MRVAAVALAVLVGTIWTLTAGCQAVPSPPKPKTAPGPVQGEVHGLTILASGARRFELVDPEGKRMLRDVRTDRFGGRNRYDGGPNFERLRCSLLSSNAIAEHQKNGTGGRAVVGASARSRLDRDLT